MLIQRIILRIEPPSGLNMLVPPSGRLPEATRYAGETRRGLRHIFT